jgi:hypothetical protein
LGIRVFGIMKVMGFCSAENLIVEVAGRLVSAFPFQPIFKKLNQAVDQPLLPADDVQATFVTVLLENLLQTALQICHRPTPEGGFSEILLWPPKAQQTLTQDSGTVGAPALSRDRARQRPEITDPTLKAIGPKGKQEILMAPIKK